MQHSASSTTLISTPSSMREDGSSEEVIFIEDSDSSTSPSPSWAVSGAGVDYSPTLYVYDAASLEFASDDRHTAPSPTPCSSTTS